MTPYGPSSGIHKHRIYPYRPNDCARAGIRVKCETVIYSKLQTKMFLNNSSRKMQIKANLLMYGNVGGGNYAAITTLFI